MIRTEKIHVVVLCDCVDGGVTSPLSQSPLAGWPVCGKSSYRDFLSDVAQSDFVDVAVCYSGHESFWSRLENCSSRVRLVKEDWPAGSAGAVRKALSHVTDGLAVIYTGNRVDTPPVEDLVGEHEKQGSDFSVVVNPDGQAAGIYVCDAAMIDLVPEDGYSDIKEFLIPAAVRRGHAVKAITLSENVGSFSDRESYLCAILSKIEWIACQTPGLVRRIDAENATVWASDLQTLPGTCRFSGSVIIMPGADIDEHCTVQGPAIIGPDVKVRKNVVIYRSVLWDRACIESDCLLVDSVIGFDAEVSQGTAMSSSEVLVKGQVTAERSDTADKSNNIASQLSRYSQSVENCAPLGSALGIGLLVACFFWSYWVDLLDLWQVWMRSDEYSSGMLVPVLAGYVLWLRRDKLRRVCLRQSVFGLVGLVAAQAFRLFGLIYMYRSAERLSIVMTIGFCVLLLGGKEMLKKTATVLMFLLLMLPWPARLQSRIALPLQGYATDSAVFCLETLGYDVTKEGTVIHIGDTSVAVAEACNGLRMITAFFVISGLVALIARRALWEKAAVFLSSLPIALICNTIRLAVTAVAFTVIKGEAHEQLFHDFGGYAMMPLALGIIVLELWIFSILTMEPAEAAQLVIRRESHTNREMV